MNPVGPTPERLALAARAEELRASGLTFREIGCRLGISRTYADALIKDPDGSLARARKDRYQGVCVDCGGPTTGSEGPAKTPERCAPCRAIFNAAAKVWTRGAVVDAIRRFAAANGRPPTAIDWLHADPVNGYPNRGSVYRSSSRRNLGSPFQCWADAIEAAGFPRPKASFWQDEKTRAERLGSGECRLQHRQRQVLALLREAERPVPRYLIVHRTGVSVDVVPQTLRSLIRRGLIARTARGIYQATDVVRREEYPRFEGFAL